MTIEIPDELYHRMKQISNEHKEDLKNIGTTTPIFYQIVRYKEIPSDYDSDRTAWVNTHDDYYEIPDDIDAMKEHLLDNYEEWEEQIKKYIFERSCDHDKLEDFDEWDIEWLYEYLGFDKVGFVKIESKENCFITTKSAKEFIQNNDKNLEYTFSRANNPDMRAIYELLKLI